MPVENLLAPDAVRRLCWAPPPEDGAAAVAAFLRAHGARDWQVELTAAALAEALAGRRGCPTPEVTDPPDPPPA